MIKPKGRGTALMVSEFIEERDGFLALSTSMHQAISQKDPSVPQSARATLEVTNALLATCQPV